MVRLDVTIVGTLMGEPLVGNNAIRDKGLCLEGRERKTNDYVAR